jgi:hypothetical protein
MAGSSEFVLHAVFCACFLGTAFGALVPYAVALPAILLGYALLRFPLLWSANPWQLYLVALELVFLLVVWKLAAVIALLVGGAPAVVGHPLLASAVLALFVLLQALPVVCAVPATVLLKIWVATPLGAGAALGAFLLTWHMAFLAASAAVGVLFLCIQFSAFLGVLADSATCGVVEFSGGVRALGGAMFCAILAVWAILLLAR